MNSIPAIIPSGLPEFIGFPKIARLSRECIITEKLDGTNAQIYITEGGQMHVGSRTRWLTVETDNHGFCRWATQHQDELITLGPGRHFGEWWGGGIQRGYGLAKDDKRFSLFNVLRWKPDWATQHQDELITLGNVLRWKPDYGTSWWKDKKGNSLPRCCSLVPVLYRGRFDTTICDLTIKQLERDGSVAVSGFMRPEGIVVYHVSGNVALKKTIENDELPKSSQVES